MQANENRPYVMTCDEVRTPVEELEAEHPTVEEPRGDDAGEGEPIPTSDEYNALTPPEPPPRKHNGELVRISRTFHVKSEKVEDKEADSLAKDEFPGTVYRVLGLNENGEPGVARTALAMDEAKRKVATDFKDCKAKDPHRCPYHGAAALSATFGEILKKHGLGDMKFSIDRTSDDPDDLAYKLDFECPKELVDTIGKDVLKDFGKTKGVDLDPDSEDSGALIEETDRGLGSVFEVDYFDKGCMDPTSEACSPEKESRAVEIATGEKPESGAETKEDEPPKEEKPVKEPTPPPAEKPKDEPPPEEEDEPPSEEDTSKSDAGASKIEAEESKPEEPEAKEDDDEDRPEPPSEEDPTARALFFAREFSELCPDSEDRINEACKTCDGLHGDIEFLKKAISGAPNDRVKTILSTKLANALSRMESAQDELKHACGDTIDTITGRLDSSKNTSYSHVAKAESLADDADFRHETASLMEECGIKSMSRMKGYKEMKKSEKDYDEAHSKFKGLMDEYDEARGKSDLLAMASISKKMFDLKDDVANKADELSTLRGNILADLNKKADKVRAEKLKSAPPDKRGIGPIPGEDFEAYSKRMKALGIPLSVGLDCLPYVKSDAYRKRCKDLGFSDDEITTCILEAKTYGEREKLSREKWCKRHGWTKEKWDSECKILTDKMQELFKTAYFGAKIWANKYGRRKDLNAFCGGSGEDRAHLMNQFESGSTSGSSFTCCGTAEDRAVPGSTRAAYSHDNYGVAYHMPADHYEKYGCVIPIKKTGTLIHGTAGWYGDVAIVFKKDKVIPTITRGDSSSCWSTANVTPPLTSYITPLIMNESGISISRYNELKERILSANTFEDLLRYSKYFELHYNQTNLGLESVEKLLLPNEDAFNTLNAKALANIRKHKVPVYVGGKLREV